MRFLAERLALFCIVIKGLQLSQMSVLLTSYGDHSKIEMKYPGIKNISDVIEVNLGDITHLKIESNSKVVTVFDRGTQTIWGIDMTSKAEKEINETLVWPIVTGTSTEVKGLVVDDINGQMFWCDGLYETIFVSDMVYGSIALPVIETDLDNPCAVEVVPEMGLIFWSDCGKLPKIERSTTRGQDRRILIKDMSTASSILADKATNRLFWFSSASDEMYCSDFTGGKLQMLSFKTITLTNFMALNIGLSNISEFKGENYYLNLTPKENYLVRPDKHRQKITFFKQDKADINSKPVNSSTADLYHGHLYGKVILLSENRIYYLPRNFATTEPPPYPESFFHDCSYQGKFKTMTIDVPRQILYLYDEKFKVIIAKYLNEPTEARTIHRVSGELEGMVVEYLSGNLYYIDSRYAVVKVINKEGKRSKTIIRKNFRPQLIDVHQTQRIIIMGVKSTNGNYSILKCSLDGSSIQYLTNNFTDNIDALTVDSKTDQIYYSRLDGILEEIHINSNNTELSSKMRVSSQEISHIFIMNKFVGLSTNTETEYILVFEKSHPEVLYTRSTSHLSWQDIKLNHAPYSSQIKGGCEHKCEHLCLHNSTSYVCQCEDGYILDSNNKCRIDNIDLQPFGLVCDQLNSKIYIFDKDLQSYTEIPLIGLRQPYAVSYDEIKQTVYWSDLESFTINRAKSDGSHQQILFSKSNLYSLGLAVDRDTGTLYFTDYSGDRILVLNTHSLHCSELRITDKRSQNISIHRPVAVTIRKSYLYLTTSGDASTVSRMKLDGSDYQKLSNCSNTCNLRGLTFINVISDGVHSPHVYWVDNFGNNIIHQQISSDDHDHEILDDTLSEDLFDISDNGDSELFVTSTSSINKYKIEEDGVYFKSSLRIFGQLAGIHIISKKPNDIPGTLCLKCRDDLCVQGDLDVSCLRNTVVSTFDKDYCKVPLIKHGDVTNNAPGAMVYQDTVINVKCYPAHHISSKEKTSCLDGKWHNLPTCIPDYRIYGNLTFGLVKFEDPGTFQFYVYKDLPALLYVVLIGGGGGGYDEDTMADNSMAGNGSHSSFGKIVAYGGTGGSKQKGGRGGEGGGRRGDDGKLDVNCTNTDVTMYSSKQLNPYYGKGGLSSSCLEKYQSFKRYRRMCTKHRTVFNSVLNATFSNTSYADGELFGGASGSNGGGSGGGGGFVCDYMDRTSLPQTVDVTVGKGGYPSYGHPGSGFVMVMWGFQDLSLACRSLRETC